MSDEQQIIEHSAADTETDSNKNKQFWLTTIDNPFNPFTQFDEWYQFDESNNYCSSGLLARIAKTSDDLSEADNNNEIENAMNWIVANDPQGIYRKVTPSDFK